MKDQSIQFLESRRPSVTELYAVNHCLNLLYETEEHALFDQVVPNLTFEELIGTLLLARDLAESHEELKRPSFT